MNPTEIHNWKKRQWYLTENVNHIIELHSKNKIVLPLRHFNL